MDTVNKWQDSHGTQPIPLIIQACCFGTDNHPQSSSQVVSIKTLDPEVLHQLKIATSNLRSLNISKAEIQASSIMRYKSMGSMLMGPLYNRKTVRLFSQTLIPETS